MSNTRVREALELAVRSYLNEHEADEVLRRIDKALSALDAADGAALTIEVPTRLHADTKKLIQDFATELALKLRRAEEKYSYSNGWLVGQWSEAECQAEMAVHLAKGDPRDVAIYCAFLWARQWSTAPTTALRSRP